MLLLSLVGIFCFVSNAAGQDFVHMEYAAFDANVLTLASPLTLHQIVFALRPKNEAWLDQKLREISDPEHRNYGKYLTPNEIAAMTVSQESSSIVSKFLESQEMLRIVGRSRFSFYITVEAPIGVIEFILNTKFFVVGPSGNESSTKKAMRALSYSLPAVLKEHVSTVFNTVQDPFAVPQRLLKTESGAGISEQMIQSAIEKSLKSNAVAIGVVYPQLLFDFYKLPVNEKTSLSSQAVFATIEQSYSVKDLNDFQRTFGLKLQKPARNMGGHELVDSCGSPFSCIEANLDMQYMMTIDQQTPTTFWYERDTSSSSFTFFLIDLANDPHPPLVVSMSYAMPEVALTYFDRYFFDLEAKKLALRGVTLVVASGDTGASFGHSQATCGYNPSFPASSPWVLAVGATQGPER